MNEFFDTNILIYARDRRNPIKQQIAQQRLEQAAIDGTGIISTQVLQEFAYTSLKKFKLPVSTVRFEVDLLRTQYFVVEIAPLLILNALDNYKRYQVSFWDSLILAAANDFGSKILVTEDLNHGQQYGNLTVENPFITSGK